MQAYRLLHIAQRTNTFDPKNWAVVLCDTGLTKVKLSDDKHSLIG